jgi:hypothetical protein
METKLISFADIRGRVPIDIVGGIVEVPSLDVIFRGKIEEISWWYSHPARIEWDEGTIWDPQFGTWNKHSNGRIDFPLEGAEYFGGPYEMESGELFIIFNKLLCLTIFPARCEPPEFPYDGRASYAAHCRITGVDMPSHMLA